MTIVSKFYDVYIRKYAFVINFISLLALCMPVKVSATILNPIDVISNPLFVQCEVELSKKELSDAELEAKCQEWEGETTPKELEGESIEQLHEDIHNQSLGQTDSYPLGSEEDAASWLKAEGEELSSLENLLPNTMEALNKSSENVAISFADELAIAAKADAELIGEAVPFAGEALMLAICGQSIASDSGSAFADCLPQVAVASIVVEAIDWIVERISSLVGAKENFKILLRQKQLSLQDTIKAIEPEAKRYADKLDDLYRATAASHLRVVYASEGLANRKLTTETQESIGFNSTELQCDTAYQSLKHVLDNNQDLNHEVTHLDSCVRDGLVTALGSLSENQFNASALTKYIKERDKLYHHYNLGRREHRRVLDNIRTAHIQQVKAMLESFNNEELINNEANPVYPLATDYLKKFKDATCDFHFHLFQEDCTLDIFNSNYSTGRIDIDGDIYNFRLPFFDDQTIEFLTEQLSVSHGLFPYYLNELKNYETFGTGVLDEAIVDENVSKEAQTLRDILLISDQSKWLRHNSSYPLTKDALFDGILSPLLVVQHHPKLNSYPALKLHLQEITDKVARNYALIHRAVEKHNLLTTDSCEDCVTFVNKPTLKYKQPVSQFVDMSSDDIRSLMIWESEMQAGKPRSEKLDLPEAWVRYEIKRSVSPRARRAVIYLHPKAKRCPGCVLYAEEVSPHLGLQYDSTQQTLGKWYIYGEYFSNLTDLALHLGGMPDGKSKKTGIAAEGGNFISHDDIISGEPGHDITDGNDWHAYRLDEQGNYQEVIGHCAADAMANAGKHFSFVKFDGSFLVEGKKYSKPREAVIGYCGVANWGKQEGSHYGSENSNQVIVYFNGYLMQNLNDEAYKIEFICHKDATINPGKTFTKYTHHNYSHWTVRQFPVTWERSDTESHYYDQADTICGPVNHGDWKGGTESYQDGWGNHYSYVASNDLTSIVLTLQCSANSSNPNARLQIPISMRTEITLGNLRQYFVFNPGPDYGTVYLPTASPTEDTIKSLAYNTTRRMCGPTNWNKVGVAKVYGHKVTKYNLSSNGATFERATVQCADDAEYHQGHIFDIYKKPGFLSRSTPVWNAVKYKEPYELTSGKIFKLSQAVSSVCGVGGFITGYEEEVHGTTYTLSITAGSTALVTLRLQYQCHDLSERNAGQKRTIYSSNGHYLAPNGRLYNNAKTLVEDDCGYSPTVSRVALRTYQNAIILGQNHQRILSTQYATPERSTNYRYLSPFSWERESEELFQFTLLDYGDYVVIKNNDGRVLTDLSTANRSLVGFVSTSTITRAQRFQMEASHINGRVLFRSLLTKTYLSTSTIDSGRDFYFSPTVYGNQSYEVIPDNDSKFTLKTRGPAGPQCVLLEDGLLMVDACSTGSASEMNYSEHGQLTINGQCLKANNDSEKVTLSSCIDTDKHQQWALIDGKITNLGAMMCLTTKNFAGNTRPELSTTNNADICESFQYWDMLSLHSHGDIYQHSRRVRRDLRDLESLALDKAAIESKIAVKYESEILGYGYYFEEIVTEEHHVGINRRNKPHYIYTLTNYGDFVSLRAPNGKLFRVDPNELVTGEQAYWMKADGNELNEQTQFYMDQVSPGKITLRSFYQDYIVKVGTIALNQYGLKAVVPDGSGPSTLEVFLDPDKPITLNPVILESKESGVRDCLAMADMSQNGANAQFGECVTDPEQEYDARWLFTRDSTNVATGVLSSIDKQWCLSVDAAEGDENTRTLSLALCDSSDNQLWVSENGQLINKASELCLASPADYSEPLLEGDAIPTPVAVACEDENDRQVWNMYQVAPERGSPEDVLAKEIPVYQYRMGEVSENYAALLNDNAEVYFLLDDQPLVKQSDVGGELSTSSAQGESSITVTLYDSSGETHEVTLRSGKLMDGESSWKSGKTIKLNHISDNSEQPIGSLYFRIDPEDNPNLAPDVYFNTDDLILKVMGAEDELLAHVNVSMQIPFLYAEQGLEVHTDINALEGIAGDEHRLQYFIPADGNAIVMSSFGVEYGVGLVDALEPGYSFITAKVYSDIGTTYEANLRASIYRPACSGSFGSYASGEYKLGQELKGLQEGACPGGQLVVRFDYEDNSHLPPGVYSNPEGISAFVYHSYNDDPGKNVAKISIPLVLYRPTVSKIDMKTFNGNYLAGRQYPTSTSPNARFSLIEYPGFVAFKHLNNGKFFLVRPYTSQKYKVEFDGSSLNELTIFMKEAAAGGKWQFKSLYQGRYLGAYSAAWRDDRLTVLMTQPDGHRTSFEIYRESLGSFDLSSLGEVKAGGKIKIVIHRHGGSEEVTYFAVPEGVEDAGRLAELLADFINEFVKGACIGIASGEANGQHDCYYSTPANSVNENEIFNNDGSLADIKLSWVTGEVKFEREFVSGQVYEFDISPSPSGFVGHYNASGVPTELTESSFGETLFTVMLQDSLTGKNYPVHLSGINSNDCGWYPLGITEWCPIDLTLRYPYQLSFKLLDENNKHLPSGLDLNGYFELERIIIADNHGEIIRFNVNYKTREFDFEYMVNEYQHINHVMFDGGALTPHGASTAKSLMSLSGTGDNKTKIMAVLNDEESGESYNLNVWGQYFNGCEWNRLDYIDNNCNKSAAGMKRFIFADENNSQPPLPAGRRLKGHFYLKHHIPNGEHDHYAINKYHFTYLVPEREYKLSPGNEPDLGYFNGDSTQRSYLEPYINVDHVVDANGALSKSEFVTQVFNDEDGSTYILKIMAEWVDCGDNTYLHVCKVPGSRQIKFYVSNNAHLPNDVKLSLRGTFFFIRKGYTEDNQEIHKFHIHYQQQPISEMESGAIKNLGGKCLDFPGGVSQSKSLSSNPYCHNTGAQRFIYEPVEQRIRVSGTDFCLDVHGGVNAHRRPVIAFPCHDGVNQKWRLDKSNIVSQLPGVSRCLDMDQHRLDEYGNQTITLWECAQAPDQSFSSVDQW